MAIFAKSVYPLVAVGRVASIRLGKMLQTEPIRGDDDLAPYLRAGSLSNFSADELPEMYASVADRSTYGVRAGDLLVAEGGDVGRTEFAPIVPPGTIIQNSLHRVRSSTMDLRFLKYCLEAIYRSSWLDVVCNKSTFGHLTLEKIRSLYVPVPPVPDQVRIANLLDAETTRIAGILTRRARQVRLLDERWRAAASELIANCGHTRSARLGVVLARLIDYRGATPEKTDSGVPLITASHISGGRVQHDLLPQFVSEETRASWMTRGLPLPGDLLLTTEAPLGEVALLNDTHVALAQRLVLLRPRPDLISSEFLYAYLRSPRGCAELQRRASGSTVMGIRSDRLRSVPVPVPDLRTQAEVARTLQLIQLDGQRLSRSIDRQVNLLKERRQALITAAVTGQLDLAREIAEEAS